MQIAHIADVHLDRPYAGLSSDAGDLARQRVRRTFTRCLDAAVERGADLITLGGDLWEEENVRVDTRRYVAQELERVQIPILIVCGNHDPYLNGGSYSRTPWPPNASVITDGTLTAGASHGDVTVWGVSWTGPGLTTAFLDGFARRADARNVLLVHGTSQPVAYYAEQSNHCPFDPHQIEAAGFDLCLAGHIHSASHRDGVVYPGSPEPLGWGETGQHCMAFAEVGDEINVDLVEVNEDRYEWIEVDCAGSSTSAEVIDRVKAALPTEGRDRLHLRADLVGEVDKDCEITPTVVAAEAEADFAELRVVDGTELGYDIEALAEQETVRGIFVRGLVGRIDKAVDDSEKRKLEIALQAGLRALDGRRDVVHVD